MGLDITILIRKAITGGAFHKYIYVESGELGRTTDIIRQGKKDKAKHSIDVR